MQNISDSNGSSYVTIRQIRKSEATQGPKLNQALIETAEWICDFIGQPHPLANKHGAICPRVPDALRADSVYLRLLCSPSLTAEAVTSLGRAMAHDFFALPPVGESARNLKAVFLVIANPEEALSIPLIDRAHRDLKSELLGEGLMLGRFHSRLDRGSIYNPLFNPHRAPVPLLSFRYMVETDIGFLMSSSATPSQRKQYIEKYLQVLGRSLPDKLKRKAQSEIERLRVLTTSKTLGLETNK